MMKLILHLIGLLFRIAGFIGCMGLGIVLFVSGCRTTDPFQSKVLFALSILVAGVPFGGDSK